MIVEGSTLGAMARLMQPMFDQFFVAGKQEALKWVGLVLVGIFVLGAFAGVAQKVLFTRIARRRTCGLIY